MGQDDFVLTRAARAFGAERHVQLIGAGERARRLRDRALEEFGGGFAGGQGRIP